MMSKRLWTFAAITALALCRTAGATGLLVPEDKTLPPLTIKYHRVNVQVTDGLAKTRLSEAFQNNTDQRLEATFIFPIPVDAALTDFAMYINGKRQSGKVVEADKARQVYEDIVRRMRDPGLLEYMGRKMLKMRVFPIEPKSVQKIELSYTCTLPFDSGVFRYRFPLRTGDKASKVMDDFTLGVEVQSTHALANIYSPTHKVGITRKGDHKAIIGFEEEGALLDKDFVLYYTVADKDFGLNLLTYRTKDQDGFFALMLAPRTGLKDEDVMPKDVCFVVDTSGSMLQESRMTSAKEAVKFCIKSLNKKDRFALVPFSTGVDAFTDGLVDATEKNVNEAVTYVEKLDPRGGTQLCGALLKGLEMVPAAGDRPYIIVLITDGKPTMGIVEPDKIVAEVKKANKGNVRIFSFGIAEKLDVPLLDMVAETTRGYSEYVEPGREIEMEVATFFRKVSHPVLSGLKLDFGKVKVRDVYPQQLPDLFRGSQVLVFGRYEGNGEVAVQLTGMMKGDTRKFAYDADFPTERAESDFIPHLWAQRKIAYLLDEIRLHGEKKELMDEVILLSKEYGIATPYTSYLVLEDEQSYVRHGIVNRFAVRAAEKAAPAPAGGPAVEREEAERKEAADQLGSDSAFLGWSAGGEGGAADAETRSGKGAVTFSKTLREWKDADTTSAGGMVRVQTTLKKVEGKTFIRIRGVWVDTDYKEGLKELKVKWGSDAYFAALRAVPKLNKYLAIGENVVVVLEGKVLIVGGEGKEKLSEQEVKDFFAD